VPEGWYLYSLTQPSGGPTRTELAVLPPGHLSGAIGAPDPAPYPDRNFNIMSEVYTDSVRFSLPVIASAREPLRVAVRYQTCTARFCLPARTDTMVAEAPVVVAARVDTTGTLSPSLETPRAALPLTLEARDAVARARALPTTGQASPAAPAITRSPTSGGGTGSLLVTAITTALLALLTPCVFPMIPITVGFFSGREATSARVMRRDLFTFAGGIVVAFVALGVGVSLLLGATGAFLLAANPWVNLIVAALFAGFALQLAGVIQFGAPHAVVTRLSRATQTGQGTAMLLLMGVTFALTSFTCTAPFVGSLLVLAASGGVAAPLVGVLAFAITFAAPFVVLALAPSLVARLPRSGPWLATVKQVAAFAELAVVVKFVSNAGMVWGWRWMTREVVISAWLLLLLALLAILGWSARPGDAVSGTRRAPSSRLAAAALLVLTMGWLGRGLTGRSLGELESYLPPRSNAALASGELPWMLNDWPAVTARAAATQRPILIDFTGYTCTNCRWMEANMFTRPAVQAMLAQFERARLYTDGAGEPYPDGRTIQQFLGMTRDEAEFLSFLAAGVAPLD
jgi:thiol:disulfide interchange protein DsbD